MGHHRKMSDPVQNILNVLEAAGLQVLEDERAALEGALQSNHFQALEHLIRRVMLTGYADGQAAVTRRQVRRQRTQAELDLVEAADEFPSRVLNWKVEPQGALWSFRHTGCGESFGSHTDPYQAGRAAATHHRRCATAVNLDG